jgi:hypothetical protein
MKTKVVAAVVVAVSVVAAFLLISSEGYGIAGFFAKAFDKSMSPGDQYERNITIRKYYNLTVRFQKEGSSSYLGFDDNTSSIVLKAANGSVVKALDGVMNGRHYVLAEGSEIAAISTASALGISTYSDVIDQPVNMSFIGTSAYLTIRVQYGQSSICGYVIDDLTEQLVDGVEVAAFADGSDTQISLPLVQNSTVGGRYQLTMNISSTKALEVYVKGYDVA